MNKEFDYLIVGSGISGMTAALLFARTGARVGVLEKLPFPGGSMQRFCRKGCPLDTGFHFTTSLTGAFGDMFHFLGMKEKIREVKVEKKIYLGESGKCFHVPHGHENILEYYASQFPGTRDKLKQFFDMERRLYHNTPLFSLKNDSSGQMPGFNFVPEDNVLLMDYLKQMEFPPELELLLCSFAICCCGTPAEEIALSSLCRISYGLHDKLVRFDGGGDAIISVFREKALQYGIEILPNSCIVEAIKADSVKTECHTVVTNQGAVIKFKECIMATHPQDILNTISPMLKTSEFQERVEEFEESCGFFTSWSVVTPGEQTLPPGVEATLVSYLNKTKLSTLMSPREPDNTATGIMTVKEHTVDGGECETVTIFENVFSEETRQWDHTTVGKRGESYAEYKEARCRKLEELCVRVCPELKGRMQFLAAASQLSYRDYLSPYGSAYGIRQKVGQFNIFGRLPVKNFYAVGQNALLPGAFGAMQSSFILWRKIIGEKLYQQEINDFLKSTGEL